ncbi:unnamed protein product [Caenorhabditis auriculariae]|uniref:CRAL-TRIO domain-containing protein n=1 Tax=Caenorhabditis auriculariae TaxID=2777116 RepID=A0A8S1GMU4_9PELO|nr:unnamed protein product [Caenorhabditis auriculariae]
MSSLGWAWLGEWGWTNEHPPPNTFRASFFSYTLMESERRRSEIQKHDEKSNVQCSPAELPLRKSPEDSEDVDDDVGRMNVQRHRDVILRKLVFLPGGQDREGCPIIVISPNADSTTPYEDVVSLMGLLSEMTSSLAFTVVVDARQSHAKQLKQLLRACQQALYKKLRLVLIVQPEKFLEQQKINFDLILEGYEFKAILISVHKLSKYVDVSQLPEQFGGTCVYEPSQWLENRQGISSALNDLSQMKRNAGELNNQRLEEVEKLAESLASSSRVDDEFASRQLKNGVSGLRKKEETEGKEEMIEEHAVGVHRFLDWIEGCGEKWLQSLCEVADNADEAENMVKQHELLEERSKDILEQSTQLADMATRLMVVCPHYSISLHKMREQVRHVGEHFSKRVEAQSKFAIANKSLQSKLASLTKHTDAMLEALCRPDNVKTLDEAKTQKTKIEQKTVKIQKLYEEAVENGTDAIKFLEKSTSTLPTKTLMSHIRAQLAYNCQRHQRCLELANVRKLKLQQYMQLFTSRKDCDQVIDWLQELYETLLRDYCLTDVSEEGVRNLREDRKQLEKTATSTYDYGKQLCRMSEMVSRILRTDKEKDDRSEKLEAKWEQLKNALQTNEARLAVVDSFNSTASQMVFRVNELEKQLREILTYRQKNSGVLGVERRRLRDDISELSRIASLLAAQINADHNSSVEGRQKAMRSISGKVELVETQFRRMESLVLEEEEPAASAAEDVVEKAATEPVPRPSPRPLSNVVEEDVDEAPAVIRMVPPVATRYNNSAIRLSHNESYL